MSRLSPGPLASSGCSSSTCSTFAPKLSLPPLRLSALNWHQVMLFPYITHINELLSLLPFWHSISPAPVASPQTALRFHLRHEHAVAQNGSLNIFKDVSSSKSLLKHDTYQIATNPVRVYRPSSRSAFVSARMRGTPLEWDEDEVSGPNVTSRNTLITLAKMTNNAYSEPGDSEWYDLGPDWNAVRKHRSHLIISVRH
jgi:hypothetical protein